MDGESGIASSSKAHEYLSRHTIKFVQRAKGQHVAHIDRRGALLRDTIHRIVAQLDIDGLELPFKQILNEAVFCGNALITVNDSTPYNAVYGRVPRLLPNINQEDAENESDLPGPGTIRHVHRLREICVQKMVEGTAHARVSRALRTKTLPAGQREDYKSGDLVDIYRPPGTTSHVARSRSSL